MKENPFLPHTSHCKREPKKKAKDRKAKTSFTPFNPFLSTSPSTAYTFKSNESPTHNLQTSTVPTPPRPHASPTRKLLPPALPPTPASSQPSSPTPAAPPKQPTSTSPPPPMLPPPPPPPPHTPQLTRFPTSQYTLTSSSVSAAYSCYSDYRRYGESVRIPTPRESPPPPRDTNADTAVQPTSRIGLSSLVTGMVTSAAPTMSA